MFQGCSYLILYWHTANHMPPLPFTPQQPSACDHDESMWQAGHKWYSATLARTTRIVLVMTIAPWGKDRSGV